MNKNICITCYKNKKYNCEYCQHCLAFSLANTTNDYYRKEYLMGHIIYDFLLRNFNIAPLLNEILKHTKYRPDIHFTYLNRLYIIEIDERAHKSYLSDEERENKILSIYPNTAFIRINIDGYISNTCKYPSIWIKNTVYLESVMNKYTHIKTNIEELHRRKQIIEFVIFSLMNSSNYTDSILIRLFYDSL